MPDPAGAAHVQESAEFALEQDHPPEASDPDVGAERPLGGLDIGPDAVEAPIALEAGAVGPPGRERQRLYARRQGVTVPDGPAAGGSMWNAASPGSDRSNDRRGMDMDLAEMKASDYRPRL
ncbi:hypothetical protein [Methylobacterium sp. SI9]|uniref:hypothetical protein n=1 Tax=Methylobacterium guangdongense TaxID=3138811 RepID=UPI00313BCAD0